jgi:hypothetical protein
MKLRIAPIVGASFVVVALVLVICLWDQDISATISSADGAVIREAISNAAVANDLEAAQTTAQLNKKEPEKEESWEDWVAAAQTEQKAAEQDPVQQIQAARQKIAVAKRVQKAAHAAKAVASMAFANANKLVHSVKGAQTAFAATQEKEAEEAVKEEAAAKTAIAKARSAVAGAKNAMRTAKAKAHEAKNMLGNYLSRHQVQHAKREAKLRREDLQSILDKVIGGHKSAKDEAQEATRVADGHHGEGAAAPDEGAAVIDEAARKAAKHAQAIKIGKAAAQAVIQDTFGSVGQKATRDELDGITKKDEFPLKSVETPVQHREVPSVHFVYDGSA